MCGKWQQWVRCARLRLLGVFVLMLMAHPSVAEDAVVPLRTQAQLIIKVAGYDRNLVARPGPRRVVILRTHTTISRRAAEGMAAELRSSEVIAGAAHQEHTLEFVSVRELRQRVESLSAQILYVCPGLEEQLPAIGNALAGLTVLSIGAGPDHANLGTVIGFDMHSGRMQLLVNLRQAQRQNVQFHAEFLKIAKVIR